MTYTSTFDCFEKTLVHDGWLSFYAGYWSFLARTLVYGFATVFTYDVITNRWKRNAGLKEWEM